MHLTEDSAGVRYPLGIPESISGAEGAVDVHDASRRRSGARPFRRRCRPGATVGRPPEARATLAIIDVQYQRALAHALATDVGARAGAVAETRRLLQTAVALRRRIAPEDGVMSDARCRTSEALPPRTAKAQRQPYEHVSI